MLVAVIGLVAWLLTTYVPMPPPVKTIVVVIACLACLLILLNAFGLMGDGVIIRTH